MTPEGATTYREALRDGIRDALQRDERVFIMGEDIGRYGGCFAVTLGLLEEFGPRRVRDTPLSESAFVGAGIGAALGGLRPIVEIMTVNFSLLALDQIMNNAATIRYMSGDQFRVPLVIRMTTGAGRQLAAQHSHSLEGWYAHIPGLRILTPATLEDARGMLWSALQDPDPVLIFEHGSLLGMRGDLSPTAGPVALEGATVRRPGRDLSLVTYGGSLYKTLEAAEQLGGDGISAEVIDLRSLRPLDTPTIIESVARTHRAVIVDEGWRSGSISAEISARITEHAFYELDAPVGRVCTAEVPIPYAKHLEDAALPQVDDIVAAARSAVSGGRVLMAEFRMPSLGADMDRGTLLEWRVAPGDEVARGDIIAVVDTDKSDIEVEVFESGVVAELLVAEGTEVAVGTPLARIESRATVASPPEAAPTAPTVATATPPRVFSPLVRHRADQLGVDLATLVGSGPGGVITRADVEHAARPAAAAPVAPVAPAPEATPTPGVRASPRARRLAAEAGLDLTAITGTGPGGAVVTADVEGHRAAPPPTRQESIRRSVARLMARSKAEIPHYYLSTTIDLAPALDWLAEVNAERSVTERLLPAALLLKASARAAAHVPEMNGYWLDDAFAPADRVDLGVAVSLRGGGLVAPAIAHADQLTVDGLMARLRDLVTRARAGSLRSSEMAEPSLTVTNLGDQGVETVFGVIYPPQVALVGFGRIVERPWAVEGTLGVHPVVTATLSADHRASDGHRGAVFLATLDRLLADPTTL